MKHKNKILVVLRKINTLLSKIGIFNWMSDRDFLKMRYYLSTSKKLNLDKPSLFNEKLQWLKIYNRKDIYCKMVDKILVKEYVKEKIGDEYVIPTIKVWNKPEEIDFEKLPKQFVIKCNHDSGGIIVCKDKATLNTKNAIKKLNKALKANPYNTTREWPYKNVERKVFAECYLEDSTTKELRDYKLFTFYGKTKALFVASNRHNPEVETTFDFFDENYKPLPIKNGHPNSVSLPEKPINFELMKKLAFELAKDIPHVRVDFYEVDGKVYFGELTFYHYGGFVPFEPNEWDEIFGSWISLSIE